MGYRFREAESAKKDPVHPVWRGIGCLLIIIIPIMALAGATILYDARIPQRYFAVTSDLAYHNPAIPWIGNYPIPYILLITAVVTFLGYVLLTVFYSLIFRVGSGSRYGPLDAPPIKRKTRKSR
ncbi:MAG: hypothetical protein H6636_05385 [Anaerolineales bacterium]|nr:hypothetical protein [Anaerolineales bacterium]